MRCYLCHGENGTHLDGCPKFGTATPQPATVIAAATITGTGTIFGGGGGHSVGATSSGVGCYGGGGGWRAPLHPFKRYFRMQDSGATYTVVARDLPHAEHILRTSGAEFSAEGWPYDRAKEAGHLHWSEIDPVYAATLKVEVDSRSACLDEGISPRRVPLVDCNLGDWFCSEY